MTIKQVYYAPDYSFYVEVEGLFLRISNQEFINKLVPGADPDTIYILNEDLQGEVQVFARKDHQNLDSEYPEYMIFVQKKRNKPITELPFTLYE